MTEADNDHDRTLVQDCLAGDLKAFEVLVDKYQKPVFNAALRIVGNGDDAQDVSQMVFTKAFEKLQSYDPKYKFFSWVYRMTINESLNWIKCRKPQSEIPENLASTARTPEEQYRRKEIDQVVEDAVGELPLDYRMVVVFRHFVDLTYRDLSFVLGIPEKTVKSRLFSARRLLGQVLRKRGMVGYD
ncbi:MAG: sigma-70 family RNA polymerase sigma factor [candidate division Zixibacteria bacterium]|nr:sigma-70 family RNA polymerase sigma factor [candidate division Zixibacteria bacterium]